MDAGNTENIVDGTSWDGVAKKYKYEDANYEISFELEYAINLYR